MQREKPKNCIMTFTGQFFDPTEPEPEKLDIRDVAHALSMLCRANGHFPVFYSVAQHSLNCAEEARARGYSERVQLACLLHDAAEAYVSDVTRPVKYRLTGYDEIEERLLRLIWAQWLPEPLSDAERETVFAVDNAMLYWEFLHYMGIEILPRQDLQSTPDFESGAPAETERQLLRRFAELTGKEK